MKIQLDTVIRNFEGKEMTTGKDEKPFTIKDVINNALHGVEMSAAGQPISLTPAEKGRIYEISMKLWAGNQEVDFVSEDITFIKARASKVANVTPLEHGRICEILEGKNKEKQTSKPAATKSK